MLTITSANQVWAGGMEAETYCANQGARPNTPRWRSCVGSYVPNAQKFNLTSQTISTNAVPESVGDCYDLYERNSPDFNDCVSEKITDNDSNSTADQLCKKLSPAACAELRSYVAQGVGTERFMECRERQKPYNTTFNQCVGLENPLRNNNEVSIANGNTVSEVGRSKGVMERDIKLIEEERLYEIQ